jgi:hypothetical protein
MHFRPGDIPLGDPTEDGPVEWEDNRLSNTMAWVSYKFLPSWCKTPEHWTSHVTQHLFTDCPCCLLFRGLTIGVLVGMFLGMMLTAIFVMALS